ncbi:GNAT family N-acetyltransferase [Paenibacillus aestuarii]|uniref:GNAT family N-acetyltransferase n=1 Tax=Paenibacillus aestuarii TaxID=516965 RepID=A0ABW0K365_9BACL|nr:GNAT family protein [Paenibacillus aestuarii]
MTYTGERIYIRFFEVSDAEALLSLHKRNREFFQAFTPLREESYYTLDKQISNIHSWEEDRKKGTKFNFGIFLKETDELIGDISLFEVIRGPLQKAMMGYSLDAAHNGKGYMSEAAKLVVRYAFEHEKLHRLEAGVKPSNGGSLRILEKAGFQREGIARKNVKINDVWEDHVMLSLLYEDLYTEPREA